MYPVLSTRSAALVSSTVEVDLVVCFFEVISIQRFGGSNQLSMSTGFPERYQSRQNSRPRHLCKIILMPVSIKSLLLSNFLATWVE